MKILTALLFVLGTGLAVFATSNPSTVATLCAGGLILIGAYSLELIRKQ